MSATRILIVEDEGIVGKDVHDTILRLGYEPAGIARSGEQALEMVGRTHPELVLMDIRLGGVLDGIETADRIMRESNVPVIYLSGYTDEETLGRAKRTSPYGYLVKPFTDRELHTCCEMALSRHLKSQYLKSSEEHLISTLRSLADGVIATDLVGNITFINPVAEGLTGWNNGDALNQPLQNVFNIREQDGAKADPLDRQDYLGNLTKSRCIMLQRRDDSQILVEDNTTPIRDSKGSMTGLVVVFREYNDPPPEGTDFIPVAEVADSATMAQVAKAGPAAVSAAAEDSSSTLAGLVESIADPLFATDEKWIVTYANNQAAEFFNTGRDTLIGANLWDCFPATLQPELLPEFQAALIRNGQRLFEFTDHDRDDRSFEASAYPFGKGVLVLLKDITQKKLAAEGKKRLDQLEGLGLLARGFAHEFNNLLTVLRGNLSAIAATVPAGSEGDAPMKAANDATRRAQDLVQQLFTFAKGGAPIRDTVAPRDLFGRFFANYQLPAHITCIPSFEENLPELFIDTGQINRALTNLVQNAVQAMPESEGSGEIRISCSKFDHSDHFSIDLPQAFDTSHDYVEITIEDTGHGIPPKLLEHVFAPFFTTRQAANATGIGLTVCESIMRAHGGGITIESDGKPGTKVTLFAPCAETASTSISSSGSRSPSPDVSKAAARPEDANDPETKPPPQKLPADKMQDIIPVKGDVTVSNSSNGRPRILILEDEPLIRQLIVSNLESEGYDVEPTAEGTETVDLFRKSCAADKPYDLLLMDLSIPNGMGGAQAMQHIRKISSDVPSIVSSGYSDDPVMSRHRDYGFTAILPKPWEPADLKAVVAGELAAHQA